MSVVLNPYLNFRDTARSALEFYQSVFGGELMLNTFAEFQASEDPAEQDKIMHGQLDAPNGLTLMASDTPNSMELGVGGNFMVSLSGDDEATLRGYWEKLSANGTVMMPLDKAPWGAIFGMCHDQFGTPWMVNISETPA